MTLDLERLRAETPGVANRIHLNNAGAALMPAPVIAAIKDHIDLEAAIGGYEAEEQEAARLEAVYDSIARLIGAGRDEIALAENATVAWDLAFYALAFQPSDRILTARAEYAANFIAYLQVAKRTGAVIEVIPDDAHGVLDPAALEAMIDARVKLISITWIPTNGGLLNPAAEVGRVARAHGVPYLLDACQAVGQLPIDVDALGCDMLAATGRKFLRGPRATGFLYLRRATLAGLEPPMLDLFGATWTGPDSYTLREDARRFETWENNYATRLGLGVAADYAMAIGLEAIQERAFALADALRAALREIAGLTVYDLGPRPCAIVSFAVEGIESEAIEVGLRERGVNVSTSSRASTLLDATARGLPVVVRASPHYYHTEDEIAEAADLVAKIAAGKGG
ncbi:MAG: aminotransferase class V-fold PLP-dependent enzyme [Kiloniellales bacterium]